jgi:hypothetical protein
VCYHVGIYREWFGENAIAEMLNISAQEPDLWANNWAVSVWNTTVPKFDVSHFVPLGLFGNSAEVVKPEVLVYHLRVVMAFRRDMGISDVLADRANSYFYNNGVDYYIDFTKTTKTTKKLLLKGFNYPVSQPVSQPQ